MSRFTVQKIAVCRSPVCWKSHNENAGKTKSDLNGMREA